MSKIQKFLPIISIVAFLLSFLVFIDPAQAAYINERVILDENYRNDVVMTVHEIRTFLEIKGSWLKDYNIPTSENVPYPSYEGGEVIIKYASSPQVDNDGASIAGRDISQMIYDLCKKYNMNPQVIMVMIQKESSAISQTEPSSESRKFWPMFFGYHEQMEMCRKNIDPETNCYEPDHYKSRAEDYGGAGKQIAKAIAYLDSKFENAQDPDVWYYYQDQINIDGYSFTCENPSTRVLYLYTPHMQYTFFNIYTSYWGHEPNILMANDVNPSAYKTYKPTTDYTSYKSIRAKVFHSDKEIAGYGRMDWTFSENIGLGANSFNLKYVNEDGKIQWKSLSIIRHRLGDIDGDNKIDVRDLSVLAKNWGRENPVEYMANMNPDDDDIVDILDLSILASQWQYN